LSVTNTMPLLEQAAFENMVPTSITEHTTKQILSDLPRRTR